MTALYPITLADIRACGPCEDGWVKLLRALGSPPKSKWADTHVTLGDIAEFNGGDDALWCVEVLPDAARRDVIRAILPSVRRAAAHTTDQRVHDCVDAVARWSDGDDDVDLKIAEDAALEAARAAAWAADAAASAWAAMWAAARAAARAAAWVAARDAERARQRADIISVFGRLHETAGCRINERHRR